MLQSYLMMPNSILYCLDSGLKTWQLHCMTFTMYKCYLALSMVFSTGATGGVELSGSSISGIGKVSTWPRQKTRMSLIIFVKDGVHISESFPTCQVRVVRFYVSCLVLLLLLLPPPASSCLLLPPPASSCLLLLLVILLVLLVLMLNCDPR